MKPNGKTFVVRMVLFAVCAVCLLSDLAKAETVRGTFKLPVEAYWGRALLQPGDYEFTVDTESAARIITVRSKATGSSYMMLSSALSDMSGGAGSSLELAQTEAGMYVRTIYLKDPGVALAFSTPKVAMRKLAASAPATTPSGTH